MSLNSIGTAAKYILPASYDSVPEALRSNKQAKPIPCSMNTVNVPSLSGNQALGGTSILQIACGASAGYMLNPYLRYTVRLGSAKIVKDGKFSFKGSSQAATACINRLATFVNSQQVDNLQNAWALYDLLLTHSTSREWLENDGALMVGANTAFSVPAEVLNGTYPDITVCVPLLGLLGSQQSIPLFLINGTLQLSVDWASSIGAVYNYDTTDPAFTSLTIADVQLVYDKLQCEQAFVDSVRADMARGQKFVVGYTNYQTTFLSQASGASATFNYGLNVSSLRGCVMNNYVATDIQTASGTQSYSKANTLTRFELSLDGRLISSVVLNSQVAPAVVFAELQKTMGRLFDASISEKAGYNAPNPADTAALANNSLFNSQNFAVGVSAVRVNEGLAFSGTPASVASIQMTFSGGAAMLSYIHFISDFQMLIGADGSIELVR